MTVETTVAAGTLAGAVEARLLAWREEGAAAKLFGRDHTLWFSEPVPELTDRLGWLDLPETMEERLQEFAGLADAVRSDGIERVVLLGMGGSSLAPEVFAQTFGAAAGFPELRVLDTTHPAAVAARTAELDPERTLFLVASKSGGTVETLSLFRHFWKVLENLDGRGRRFVAVTDPGSPLEALAAERGFRAVVTAPPDVGGRFSALSPFGLLPAALLGMPVDRLLAFGRRALGAHREYDGPGWELGALLGEAARVGRDKLTFVVSPRIQAFPSWLEQLLAESLGKEEQGVVPVIGEVLQPEGAYTPDRIFVRLRVAGEEDRPTERALDALEAAGHPVVRMELAEPLALGEQVILWEVATALAGSILGVNPFDQPDVQLAKEMAGRAMEGGPGLGSPEKVPAGDAPRLDRALGPWLAAAEPHRWVAIQAFLAPSPEVDGALTTLRRAVEDRLGLPVTVGYGPRFLHSTGQLHKGGPPTGLFLQLVDRPEADLPIPETDHTFGRLIAAQADGDAAALARRGRMIVRVDVGGDPPAGIEALASRIDGD